MQIGRRRGCADAEARGCDRGLAGAIVVRIYEDAPGRGFDVRRSGQGQEEQGQENGQGRQRTARQWPGINQAEPTPSHPAPHDVDMPARGHPVPPPPDGLTCVSQPMAVPRWKIPFFHGPYRSRGCRKSSKRTRPAPFGGTGRGGVQRSECQKPALKTTPRACPPPSRRACGQTAARISFGSLKKQGQRTSLPIVPGSAGKTQGQDSARGSREILCQGREAG